jgi:hypothetical protein
MTMTLILKSGVTGNCYAPFGSGGEGSDPLTDHNWVERILQLPTLDLPPARGHGYWALESQQSISPALGYNKPKKRFSTERNLLPPFVH